MRIKYVGRKTIKFYSGYSSEAWSVRVCVHRTPVSSERVCMWVCVMSCVPRTSSRVRQFARRAPRHTNYRLPTSFAVRLKRGIQLRPQILLAWLWSAPNQHDQLRKYKLTPGFIRHILRPMITQSPVTSCRRITICILDTNGNWRFVSRRRHVCYKTRTLIIPSPNCRPFSVLQNVINDDQIVTTDKNAQLYKQKILW